MKLRDLIKLLQEHHDLDDELVGTNYAQQCGWTPDDGGGIYIELVGEKYIPTCRKTTEN